MSCSENALDALRYLLAEQRRAFELGLPLIDPARLRAAWDRVGGRSPLAQSPPPCAPSADRDAPAWAPRLQPGQRVPR